MDYDVNKQHLKGKLHAIERIRYIVDPNSFCEIDQEVSNIENSFGIPAGSLPYDGVITGTGKVHGRKVYIYSQDFTIMGGTLGKNHGLKIARVIQRAIKERCPIIGINDSGGARIQEGVDALAGYGEIFYYNTLASGVIPQIAIIAGPCAGGAVYSPGIMDFIFNIDEISTMFVTGPKVVKSVTNEEVSALELGGAAVHSEVSGVSHFRCQNEPACYQQVRKLFEYIPFKSGRLYPIFRKSGIESASRRNLTKQLNHVLPSASCKSYDVKKVIRLIVDEDSFLEIQEDFARNVVIGFAKMSGNTIGIVANQPGYMAGVLDCDSSDKAARFIRYCDSFRIPIVTLTDVPGFLPGTAQEQKGIIRHGAKLLYAYSEATTIKLNVILRKAYGGAYIGMCSKHLRADEVYAWPQAEIAVMGAVPACQILYAKELRERTSSEQHALIEEMAKKYQKNIMNADKAVQAGYITEVIQPEKTREYLIRDLCRYSRKKRYQNILHREHHGNIPL